MVGQTRQAEWLALFVLGGYSERLIHQAPLHRAGEINKYTPTAW